MLACERNFASIANRLGRVGNRWERKREEVWKMDLPEHCHKDRNEDRQVIRWLRNLEPDIEWETSCKMGTKTLRKHQYELSSTLHHSECGTKKAGKTLKQSMLARSDETCLTTMQDWLLWTKRLDSLYWRKDVGYEWNATPKPIKNITWHLIPIFLVF